MHYYKTTFTRDCFSFGEKITHSYDVVIEIDEPEFTNDKCNKFYNKAWEAVQKQIPVIKESGLPLEAGWSSVVGGHTYTKLDIPWMNWKIQKPSKGKPVIGCIFKTPKRDYETEASTYRATGFYKFIKHTNKPSNDVAGKVIDEILMGENPNHFKPRWILVKCIPKEAQVISGCGVAGCLELIKNVTIGELVKWNDIYLKQEQWQYNENVKKIDITDERIKNRDILSHYGKKWIEELGLTI